MQIHDEIREQIHNRVIRADPTDLCLTRQVNSLFALRRALTALFVVGDSKAKRIRQLHMLFQNLSKYFQISG